MVSLGVPRGCLCRCLEALVDSIRISWELVSGRQVIAQPPRLSRGKFGLALRWDKSPHVTFWCFCLLVFYDF